MAVGLGPAVPDRPGDDRALRLRPKAWVLLAVASALGLVAFGWPLLARPHGTENLAHSADAPWIFVALLPLLFAIVVAEIADGALDAKAVALLGVLAACGCALRLPGGVSGFEPVFFLLIPSGRVLGRGLRLRARRAHDLRLRPRHRRGRPLAAVPDVRCGLGGLLRRVPATGQGPPRARRAGGLRLRRRPGLRAAARLLVLAVRGQRRAPSCSYLPDASVLENLQRFWAFHLATALGWDLPRAVTNAVLVLLLGRPVLAALRRVARQAAFGAPVTFEPSEPTT